MDIWSYMLLLLFVLRQASKHINGVQARVFWNFQPCDWEVLSSFMHNEVYLLIYFSVDARRCFGFWSQQTQYLRNILTQDPIFSWKKIKNKIYLSFVHSGEKGVWLRMHLSRIVCIIQWHIKSYFFIIPPFSSSTTDFIYIHESRRNTTHCAQDNYDVAKTWINLEKLSERVGV